METSLKKEINNLVNNQWTFLFENYIIIKREHYHRTELQPLKSKSIIKVIKDELLKKLGYIAVFFFIQLFFSMGDYPNPYRNIDKVLLVLYQLVSGKSIKDMHEYMSYSSYHKIQDAFWNNQTKDKKYYLKKIVINGLENIFSTQKIRILSARLKNPKLFKGVTLFLDGHDSKIDLCNILVNKKKSIFI